MLSINTNISDLILINSLNTSTNGLNQTMERLTTGFKLNHAKDNAAGIGIINQLSTKISSLLQIQDNTADGVSLLSTAQGALEDISGQLERLRGLALQASNGNYDKKSRDAMQAEADEIIAEINRIRNTTTFNGMNLFGNFKEVKASNISPASRLNTSARLSTRAYSPARAALYSTPAPYAVNDVVEGSSNFTAHETKTVTIDGIEYIVKNRAATKNNLSYTKDLSTDEVTFLCSNFEIQAQKDVSHIIVINGTGNYIHGGDLDDTLSDLLNSQDNRFYGEGGNDTIISNGNNNFCYGGADNDTITINKQCYMVTGEDGDDVININSYGNSGAIYGGAGNDIFNIYSENYKIMGEDGDDTFNIIGSLKNLIIDGGAGVNTVTGNIGSNIIANADKANAYLVDLVKGIEKEFNINGTKYKASCSNSDTTLIYSINDSGQIKFTNTTTSVNITITGQEDKVHNLDIAGFGMTFTGGYKNDTICVSAKDCYIKELGGDNTITIKEGSNYIYAGDGNNNITINPNGSFSTIICGNGDNNITNNSQCNIIYAGSGNNTISKLDAYSRICGFGDFDNSKAILLNEEQTKNITFGEIQYSVKNTKNVTSVLLYNYNNGNKEMSFGGYGLNIAGDISKAQNVKIYGQNMEYQGSNLDDNIKSWGRDITIYANDGNDNIQTNLYGTNIYTGNGNNTIEMNSDFSTCILGNGKNKAYLNAVLTQTLKGGTGGNTFYINNSKAVINNVGGDNIYHIDTNDAVINGSQGNDTFYITGNNNTVAGGGGDDYFIVTGNNNTLDGGTGNDLYTDSGTANKVQNMHFDPNSGNLHFTYQGEIKTFEIDGNIYTVTNNNTGENDLSYSKNPNTGILGLNGSKLTINTPDIENIIDIYGSNNTINGGKQSDNITIQSGTGNTINGGEGDDFLTSNTANNTLNGDAGNDTIILSGDNNTAVGGSGNDKFNIKTGNNNFVDGSDGKDLLEDSGIDTLYKNITKTEGAPFSLSLKVGIGNGESKTIDISIAFNLEDLTLNLSSCESALVGIDIIDNILSRVSNELLKIGTTLNRLDSVMEEQQISLENMISSRSTIRDADIADESSNLIKYQILQQAATTLMSTANQSPALALQLL